MTERKKNMLIRQERPGDHGQVYELIKAAFAGAEHADGNEQDLVNALRKGGAFIPELSLVAEEDVGIVGHILFTRAAAGGETVLVLAPLSVRPDCQRRGIGTALMKEGHRIARELGYGYSTVLGSTEYYPRVGYVPAEELGIDAPEGIPAENLMAIRLREDAPPVSGVLVYAAEFGVN